MKTIEVMRPNPDRVERCKIDKSRRVGRGYAFVEGENGDRFLATMYMGAWGQDDGWFDCWRKP